MVNVSDRPVCQSCQTQTCMSVMSDLYVGLTDCVAVHLPTPLSCRRVAVSGAHPKSVKRDTDAQKERERAAMQN